MKAYITKYALTQGIYAVDANKCSDKMIEYKTIGSRYSQYAHGAEFHTCKESAVDRAEQMRQNKLSSLRAQIAKIESIVFEVEE